MLVLATAGSSVRPPRLRALLVDVGGVLVAQAVWDGLPENGAHRELQLARLHDAFGGERPWFRSVCAADYGSTQPPTWEQPTRGVLERLLSNHDADLTDGDMRRICGALAVPIPEFGTLESGAIEAVRAARGLGLKLAICSNTLVRTGEDYRRDLAHFGLAECFDAYVTSLDVGYGKPHPAMFEHALTALDTRPDEAGMVGDQPQRDILGARALGLRTIWRRPPDFVGACEPVPDAEIGSLWELPAILEEWVT